MINFANSIPNGSPLIKDKYILKKNLDDFIDKNKKLALRFPFFHGLQKKKFLKFLKKTNFSKLKMFNTKNFENLIKNKRSFFKHRLLIWQVLSFCVWEKLHNHT